MRSFVMTMAAVALTAGAALAAPPAPTQAPVQKGAVQKAVQAPTQSPAQSPTQKGGAYSARVDSGYRSYSYEPGYSSAGYNYYGDAFGRRNNRAAWSNATAKALGNY